jgi:hypothetical protein
MVHQKGAFWLEFTGVENSFEGRWAWGCQEVGRLG